MRPPIFRPSTLLPACPLAACLLVAGLLVAGLLAATAASSQPSSNAKPKAAPAPVALDRLVSEDVLAYAAAPDARKLADALAEQSPFAKLLAHPEVDAFLSPLTDAVSALEGDISGFLGGGWTLLGRSLTGSLALAISAPDGEGPRAIPNAVVSMPLKGIAVFRGVVDRLGRALPMQYQVVVAREPVAGQTVTVFEWGERFALYLSFVGDVLYASNSATAMESVLLALKRGGEPRALAESTAYQRACLRVKAAASHHYVYLNVARVWRETDRLFGRGFPEYDFMMKTLDSRKVHTIAMSMVVGPDGFRERAYVGGKEDAVRQLVRPDLAGSAWAKGSSVVFMAHRMNWPTLYRWFTTSLDDAARRFQSATLRSLHRRMRLAEEGAIGIDLAADIFGALGDEVMVRADLPVGGLIPQFLAIAKVKDGPRLAAALKKIREALPPDGSVKLRQSTYRSQAIYQLRNDSPVQPAFAVVKEYFVAAANVNVLKRWIRRPEGGLDRSESFVESLKRIDRQDLKGTMSAFFVDTSRALAFLYDNFAPLISDLDPYRINLGMRAATMTFNQMPSTNAVASHFKPMIVTTRLIEDGIAIDAHTPAPYLGTAYALAEGTLFTGMTGQIKARPVADASAKNPAVVDAAAPMIPGELGVLVDDDYAADGCRIARVLPDTAAKAAGLQDGDVISRIDGAGLKDADAAFRLLAKKPAGTTVKLDVVRGGKALRIDVKLRPKP